MTNFTPSRLGQINEQGDALALFLKVFSGEVLTEFERDAVFLDKHMIRTISSGKSASFPAIGKSSGAAYHVPGEQITGKSIKHGERVVTIDGLLLDNVFIPNIDEAMNHYDVRSEYSRELADSLAQAFDRNVAIMGVLAARDTATITGRFGGSVINAGASVATDKDVLRTNYFAAAQDLDEKDVPSSERFAFVKPAQYYLSAQDTVLLNRDFAGNGSISSGTIETAAGLTLVKTNNLPTGNIATGLAKYQGDFSDTVALVMRRGAVGTTKLLDMQTEAEYQISRQGTLVVAKYAMGHGIVRPHEAIEISAAV